MTMHQPVELDHLVCLAGIGCGSQLGLKVAKFRQPLRGRGPGSTRGKLAGNVCLDKEQVFDILGGQRCDNEPPAGLEGEEAFTAEGMKRLAHRSGTDGKLFGHSVQPHELTGPQRPRHDQGAHVRRNLLTQRLPTLTTGLTDLPTCIDWHVHHQTVPTLGARGRTNFHMAQDIQYSISIG